MRLYAANLIHFCCSCAVAEAERAKDQLTSLADINAPGGGDPTSELGGLTGKRKWLAALASQVRQ